MIIVKILMLLLILVGVIMIYDARIIIKNFFSFGDQNEGSLGLKVWGFFIVIVAGIILFFISK